MAEPSKYRQTVTLTDPVDRAVRKAAKKAGLSVSRWMFYATLKQLGINEQGEAMPDGWHPYGL